MTSSSRVGSRYKGTPRELLALVPPAFAQLGGPYLHTSQMALAVPALLPLLVYFPEWRTWLSVALSIMMIPWAELAENPLPVVVIAVIAAGMGFWLLPLRAQAVRATAIVAVMTLAAACEPYIRATFPPVHVSVQAELAEAASGSLLTDATWSVYARSTVSNVWFTASHIPAWTGLALMIGVATALAPGRARPENTVLRDDAASIVEFA